MENNLSKKLPILRFPVIVEGRYDKSAILGMYRATVITTEGFGIFNSKEKQALIRKIARDGIILLTDSDGGGKQIRSFLSGIIPKDKIYHLYIPMIEGKERRKEQASAEGILGVEGMENQLLRELLAPYADSDAVLARMEENPLSKTDFFVDGLTGGVDSGAKRDAFAQKLGLPAGMTPNALLAAVRMLCSYEEYCRLVGREES
jgi:ribonuclease M5